MGRRRWIVTSLVAAIATGCVGYLTMGERDLKPLFRSPVVVQGFATAISNPDATKKTADSDAFLSDAELNNAFSRLPDDLLRVEPSEGNVGAEDIRFTPVRGARISEKLYALILEGEIIEHACHACIGMLRIIYVTKPADNFYWMTNPAITVDIPGMGWGSPPDWKLQRRDGKLTLLSSSGYSQGGCTETATSAYLLLPDRIMEDPAASDFKTDCDSYER